MKHQIELCIRDSAGRIIAWEAGMSEDEIDAFLANHGDEGAHRSCAVL